MTDIPEMSSADTAAAGGMARRLRAEIESVWEAIEGPSAPLFRWRRLQGLDGQEEYEELGVLHYSPHVDRHTIMGVKSLGTLTELFPSAFDAVRKNFEDLHRESIGPETHRVVWRIVPEIIRKDDGLWYLYARLAFMPKDAWLLAMEGFPPP